VTVSRKGDLESQLALSSLIRALYELESYAVARLVMKDDKEPLLVLLSPSIDVATKEESLYDVPLPFAEDVRAYSFPPLDKVVTVSGTTLTTHRLLPSDELSKAMSNYVDAMDISTYSVDEAG
jgi:ATP-dependent DNA helicase 2 subunit 2